MKTVQEIHYPDIPYNMSYKFGEDLHEIPDDIGEMKNGIEYLKNEFKLNPNAGIAGLIGTKSRMIGELEQSEKFLNIAIEWYGKTNNMKGIIINKIRLAMTYQFQKDFAKSDSLLAELESGIHKPEFKSLKHFLFQHIGKNKFDQGVFDDALIYFKKALDLRLEKGDEELIASTKFAIQTTIKKFEK